MHVSGRVEQNDRILGCCAQQAIEQSLLPGTPFSPAWDAVKFTLP